MENSVIILHFLSAFAALNGLLLSFFLCFFTKFKNSSNYFLATLIVLFSIRAAVAILVCVNYSLDWFYLQLGITVCFFFGPFLYFYVASVFNPKNEIKRTWIYHIILFFILALGLGILFPSKNNNALWKKYLINIPYLIWLFYIIRSGILIKSFILKKQKNSDFKNWLKIIFFGNIFLWIIHVTSRFTSYAYISFSIGVLIYLLLFFLIFITHKSNIFSVERIKLQITSQAKIATELIVRLEQIMLEDELFKNKQLKSSIVANKLGVPVYMLSEIISQTYHTNFSNYINNYRIEYAKKLLVSTNYYTIEAIGQESGFTSKSSFYAAFKKNTGTTPSNFV